MLSVETRYWRSVKGALDYIVNEGMKILGKNWLYSQNKIDKYRQNWINHQDRMTDATW